MEYRLLGRSGLKVSAITMGTMTFGRSRDGVLGNVSGKEAKRQVDQCIEAGVNLIDTADVYAARRVGGDPRRGARQEARRRAGRHQGTLPTWARAPNDRGISRAYLVAECERSLKRLRTDWIDLYQVHQWDGQTPLEETMEALDSLVQSGKVRYVGCSNFSGWHIMKALGAAARLSASRSSASRSTTRCRRARPNTNWCRSPRSGPRHSGVEPDRRRASVGQIPPRQEGTRRLPPFRAQLARAADPRRGEALRHRRGAGRRRQGAQMARRRAWRSPGSWQPGRDLGHGEGGAPKPGGSERKGAGGEPNGPEGGGGGVQNCRSASIGSSRAARRAGK